jgi:phosphate starvation-inducible PhoH-like protein
LSEIILNVANIDLVDLFGENNVKLKLIRDAFPEVKIVARGSQIKMLGEKKNTQRLKGKIELMINALKEFDELSTQTVKDLLNGDNPFASKISSKGNESTIVYGRGGKPIKARTLNQKLLVDTCEDNDIVFAVGPAGTGKTYIAVALAVRALKNRVVKKIIMTRPAVEAGENLGFLPGDLKEKVDPYLRPLYDALDDMIPTEKLDHLISTRVIEVAPLAFMRGRTLDNAFVIMDEAQNSTSTQIKMFLTRLGPSAKCVITGDLSQIDLPRSVTSGLKRSLDVLTGIQGIGVVRLNTDDVVRHRLVKAIIIAYNESEERRKEELAQAKLERDSSRNSVRKDM